MMAGASAGAEAAARCGILLFDDVDLMDVAGPYEVLLTASRLELRRGHPAPFDVTTLGLTLEPVTAFGGLRLTPQELVDEASGLDVLVVPGAVAIEQVESRGALVGGIRDLSERTRITASVCTGAFLLERAGLLSGHEATTHWEDLPALSERIGGDSVRSDVRWTDAGTVVTAAGLSSGIAMALHLVDRLASRDLAERTARQIDYAWSASR